jgi:hypothetical protein
MTSVPKPLKFLRPFYDEMGKIREGWSKDLVEQRVSWIKAGNSTTRKQTMIDAAEMP